MPKILIVDDEQEFVDTYSTLIEQFMKVDQVYCAINSDQAFKLIEEKSPNIIIADYNLQEEFSGIHVYQKAKEKNPKAIGCIITGNIEAKTEELCNNAGIRMILEKPLDLMSFKDEVNKLIEQSKEV